jgi:hypothetical protein
MPYLSLTSSLCVTVREARAATRLALDVHKGQRLPWVDHHRVRPRRARASELTPVDALDRRAEFVNSVFAPTA